MKFSTFFVVASAAIATAAPSAVRPFAQERAALNETAPSPGLGEGHGDVLNPGQEEGRKDDQEGGLEENEGEEEERKKKEEEDLKRKEEELKKKEEEDRKKQEEDLKRKEEELKKKEEEERKKQEEEDRKQKEEDQKQKEKDLKDKEEEKEEDLKEDDKDDNKEDRKEDELKRGGLAFGQVDLNYLLKVNELNLVKLEELGSQNNFDIGAFSDLFASKEFNLKQLLELQQLSTMLKIAETGIFDTFELSQLELGGLDLGLIDGIASIDLTKFIDSALKPKITVIAKEVTNVIVI
ncbi:hypothetical protein FHETE_721 [Fusarium heterosporum]|uniref:Uncharacterized protein n=1 Tax=Fusarium heterosporum TaxID=42747 RepID=A0A8H5U283_FUSHE|nr:hypothetical protein FHETE_721 [Fusarium heterosporum]